MESNKHPESDIGQILGMNASSGRKMNLKRVAFTVLAAGFVLIALISWKTHTGSEAFQYQTTQAVLGDLTITVGATGNLEPRNQVDVGSELSGIIKTVDVDYNDHVDVGQVLACLDTEKLQSQVNNSRAALESAHAHVMQAQASLKETQAELERLKHVHELSSGKVPSAYNLESAEAAYAKAKADLAGAQAQATQARAVLESAETDLSKALIRSPIHGIVLIRNVEPGQTVAASLQAPVLFTLAEDLAQMELHVDVDEADVGQVRQGQDATFTVDAYPDLSFPASITQVRYGATNTAGVITYETVLLVDNDKLLLRPGMTATADILVSTVHHAVLVPNAALRFEPPAAQEHAGKKKNEGTSVMSKLFPRRPRHEKSSSNQMPGKDENGRQRVWRLQDGRPVPVSVTTGVTNGIMTEIIGNDIQPGMELIVGTVNTHT
ncbi:MAG: efflux RND transporter periplasmic adaptor subunit [Desulfomonilia bacterium]